MDRAASKIRVLVVDDSVVARRMVARVIDGTADMTVAATAANGEIALAKLSLHDFDAVVLDVEMPKMGGLETLSGIRATHPSLPVVMFSSLTHRGAEITLDALSLGANDYVTKPTAKSPGEAEAWVASELVPKIRAIGRAPSVASRPPGAKTSPLPPRVATRPPSSPVAAIAIGCSTGGPRALQTILPRLPGDLPVPVFIVQHMPPVFTRLLAERLDGVSEVSVVEAQDGALAEPGTAYVAPGDFHLEVHDEGSRSRLVLTRDPHENSCRPSVDVLFRSLARVFGGRVLAAVLTGMGKDGLEGSRSLVEGGAHVIAQDEASSVVWGMPSYVVRAELAYSIATPTEIARALTQAVSQPGNEAAFGGRT